MVKETENSDWDSYTFDLSDGLLIKLNLLICPNCGNEEIVDENHGGIRGCYVCDSDLDTTIIPFTAKVETIQYKT